MRTRRGWEKRGSAGTKRWRNVNVENRKACECQQGRQVKSHIQIAAEKWERERESERGRGESSK